VGRNKERILLKRKEDYQKQFGRFIRDYPVQSVHAALIHRFDFSYSCAGITIGRINALLVEVNFPDYSRVVGHPEVIARRNCATAAYAHGCASASPVKWPLADVPGSRALGNWYARLGVASSARFAASGPSSVTGSASNMRTTDGISRSRFNLRQALAYVSQKRFVRCLPCPLCALHHRLKIQSLPTNG